MRRLAGAGAVLALLLVVTFGVAAPPERCPGVTVADLRASSQRAVDWFARNQHPDGTWLYLYDARDDAAPPEYNVVRHAGALMGLYQAHAAGLPRALAAGDRGTAWALHRLIERDGWAALPDLNDIPVGSTALLAAGLAIRREATRDRRHDAVLRRLGRFLVAQTQRSGAVLAFYDAERRAPVPGEFSKYYTGEAYWALTLLQRAFPREGWGRAADRIGAYLATRRDDVEGNWPPIADHWAAYGLAETASRRPLTAGELRYARRQAELFGFSVRWVAARFAPWGAAVRGRHVLRGGGYGVIGEALTNLWLVARAEPALAELREPIARRTACNAGLAIRAQSGPADARRAARPDRVEGAWFRDGETRMDDQQHALAALLRTMPIVAAEQDGAGGAGGALLPPVPLAAAGGAPGSRDAPSAWLWLAALLLALNPARAVFAVPRGGRAALTVTAAGTAIGGLVVCAVAALADPLLDLLDVSDPSLRIGAGVVAVLAGLVDFAPRPAAPEPALPGRRAALVPVAVPVVARPALLVVALGAGADRGVLLCAGAMALGAAALLALAARRPDPGPGDRVLRWAGRLLAAGLVVAGVLLAVDGIYDV